jgi:uracil-DNA glycosylase family 4
MTEASAANKHLDHRRVAPEGLFRRPRLYLVGEAPGAEETEQGMPFVGAAGSALRKMLEEAGIDPRQLRLANAIPFRPIAYSKDRKPRNRIPTIEEIEHYGAAVLTDIRRSGPGVIVALGTTAARLFGESRSIRAARKAKLQFESHPLCITFHPAYVRRFGGGTATFGIGRSPTCAKRGKNRPCTSIQVVLGNVPARSARHARSSAG